MTMKIRILFTLLYLAGVSCEQDNTVEPSVEIPSNEISKTSEITCPYCGFKSVEMLPTEYCLIAYECKKCRKTLNPRDGDCCVFCSYGTYECPSIQEERLQKSSH